MGHICLQRDHGRNGGNGSTRNSALAPQTIADTAAHTSATSDRKKIGFLGFDGVRTLDLTSPLEAFAASGIVHTQEAKTSGYQIVLIGLNRKSFVSDSGIIFKAQETTQTAAQLDTIVIPGGSGLRRPGTVRDLSAWLAVHAPRARRVAAVCGGIYPLAECGLLDGRQVTTHWRFAHDLAKRFPAICVKPNASFLKDGPFYTCGGGTAGIEMSLSLINEDQGPGVALALARDLVARLRPPGSDADQVDLSLFQSGPSEKIAELPAWILAHIADDLSVEALAKRACVCPRHLRRLFQSIFKKSPADFVEQLRLREAGRRLETSRHSIESIASAVGYASADAFRRAFERRLGVTPTRYRRQALVT
jgi:transcriptional regulator GlxA family with amidase domain